MRAETAEAEARFLNRELSWLDFNARVLEVAADESLPLLERVNFSSIYSSNLDEFFMVRVAGLLDQVAAGIVLRSTSRVQLRACSASSSGNQRTSSTSPRGSKWPSNGCIAQ